MFTLDKLDAKALWAAVENGRTLPPEKNCLVDCNGTLVDVSDCARCFTSPSGRPGTCPLSRCEDEHRPVFEAK